MLDDPPDPGATASAWPLSLSASAWPYDLIPGRIPPSLTPSLPLSPPLSLPAQFYPLISPGPQPPVTPGPDIDSVINSSGLSVGSLHHVFQSASVQSVARSMCTSYFPVSLCIYSRRSTLSVANSPEVKRPTKRLQSPEAPNPSSCLASFSQGTVNRAKWSSDQLAWGL